MFTVWKNIRDIGSISVALEDTCKILCMPWNSNISSLIRRVDKASVKKCLFR